MTLTYVQDGVKLTSTDATCLIIATTITEVASVTTFLVTGSVDWLEPGMMPAF